MVHREVWEAIRRMAQAEGLSVSELARRVELDRKTVRHCLRQDTWRPYRRPGHTGTLLAEHGEFLQARAPEVQYSARILYQELQQGRGYRGSYETVKLVVRPLRAARSQAERALIRFETPPGLQSQIDWGQARMYFGARPVTQHLFVLTLGYSRRSFYCAYPDEKLGAFLEAHERAFEHFGGHTHEHLYDRPRTVCRPRVVWHPTLRAFGGLSRGCAKLDLAQTKGKVESGVKYVKRNFLPGRTFIDQADFDEQLTAWTASIADVRIHGTTHERPLDRFAREQAHLVPTASQPSFKLEMQVSRIVAEDSLISFETNRYAVPFSLS